MECQEIAEEAEEAVIDHFGRLYDACVNGVLDYWVVLFDASIRFLLLDVFSVPAALNFELVEVSLVEVSLVC